MVGISPDRDGTSFRAFLVTTHPVKATHFGGSITPLKYPSIWIISSPYLSTSGDNSGSLLKIGIVSTIHLIRPHHFIIFNLDLNNSTAILSLVYVDKSMIPCAYHRIYLFIIL
ncbi:unnamed protein product [Cuscuta epithymum]|uniref:Uncharacterized protein n=1 Tax=Cuscuta epithymum TaxID=186058 RepID=A0AAV0E356_9ASTE|nr:unnamed protein product [Cuscuta epithymum]